MLDNLGRKGNLGQWFRRLRLTEIKPMHLPLGYAIARGPNSGTVMAMLTTIEGVLRDGHVMTEQRRIHSTGGRKSQ